MGGQNIRYYLRRGTANNALYLALRSADSDAWARTRAEAHLFDTAGEASLYAKPGDAIVVTNPSSKRR